MKTEQDVLGFLVAAAAVPAVRAGIGTEDFSESTSGLCGRPNTAVITSGEWEKHTSGALKRGQDAD